MAEILEAGDHVVAHVRRDRVAADVAAAGPPPRRQVQHVEDTNAPMMGPLQIMVRAA